MNDTPVSRAIHSTHFAIISVFVFIFLLGTLLYLWLCNGIELKRLAAGGTTIEKLYIKWDKKLFVTAHTVRLKPRADASPPSDFSSLHDAFVTVASHLDDRWLGSLRIERLVAGDANLSVDYAPSKGGSITYRSPLNAVDVMLAPPLKRRIHMAFSAKSTSFDANISGQGELQLDTGRVFAGGHIDIAREITLRYAIQALEKRLDITLSSTKPFKRIAPAVAPFHLDKDVAQWIVSRARTGLLSLHMLKTSIPYDNPSLGFANLYAHLTVTGARYDFAPRQGVFEPAKAPKVELFFDDKKLFIVPLEATFYGQSGGGTWLDIDFAPREPVLDLFIDTEARFTPELRRLVKAYGIELPFLQRSGLTLARLNLHIVLPTSDVSDSGRFYIHDSTVDYEGLALDINDTFFTLEGTRISLRRMHASLLDRAVALSVSGHLDPASEKGRLDFTVYRAHFQTDPSVELADVPLRFRYDIHPQRDRIRFDPSHWIVGNRRFEVDGFTAPFSYGKLTLQLPKTTVMSPPWFEADVSGSIGIKDKNISLRTRLKTLRIGRLHNAQKPIVFDIVYGDGLTIATHTPSYWYAGDSNLSVGPMQIVSTPDRLVLEPTRLHVERLVEGQLEGVLDPNTGASALTVKDLHFINDAFSNLFRRFEAMKVYVIPENEEYDVIVPSLNMRFSTLGAGWKLHFYSLDALVEDSPLLQEYNITQGEFTAWSETGEFPFDFNGTLDYPYAILRHGDQPVSTYRLHGRFDAPVKADVYLNDAVKIHVDQDVNITSSNVAFDFSQMLRFYEDHEANATETNATNTETLPVIRLDADQTAIVFDDGRRAPADRLSLLYRNGRLTAKLFKGRGGALLEAHEGRFYLYGNDLDDEFMNRFFRLSHFQGGRLDFYVIGDTDTFDGLIVISDTTVYDYVLLNNLFAFMNTVPALVTFSLPSYASKGIRIDQAYANLHYQNGVMKIDGIKVDSKEMDFAGMGSIDYNDNRLSIELSVKTQAGKNIRKLPVVGYILVGDGNSALTTVKIDGPIDNPNVTSTIAKDIVVAPFNLIKRAFNFPLHYLELFEKKFKNTSPSPRKKKKRSPHQITSGIPLEPGKE